MSILPFLLKDLEAIHLRPSRILDQHFGSGLVPEDFLAPHTVPPRAVSRYPLIYHIAPWNTPASTKEVGSTVTVDKNMFHVNLDVQQFSPEEISVKVTGKNSITVEGKHEEKQDAHGHVSRHFVRRYILPEGHDIDKVVSTLSSDGVLNITAPRCDGEQPEERPISIIHTGVPSKVVEKKIEQADIN